MKFSVDVWPLSTESTRLDDRVVVRYIFREQLYMPVHLPIQRNIVPLTDFHFLTLCLLPLFWQVSSEILISEGRMWTNDVSWILLRKTHLHWPALIYRESGFYYILRFVSSTSGRYPTSILSLSLLPPLTLFFLFFSAALSSHFVAVAISHRLLVPYRVNSRRY